RAEQGEDAASPSVEAYAPAAAATGWEIAKRLPVIGAGPQAVEAWNEGPEEGRKAGADIRRGTLNTTGGAGGALFAGAAVHSYPATLAEDISNISKGAN